MVEVAHDHLEAKVLLTQQILNYMVAVVAAVGMVMVAPISKLSLSLSLSLTHSSCDNEFDCLCCIPGTLTSSKMINAVPADEP
jgi:hypothetical protein